MKKTPLTKTSARILHSYGKGNGCTNNGISENKDTLTLSWGIKDIESADTDLVLCDGTNGRTEVIRDEAHFRSVIGTAGGYVKAVAVKHPKGQLGPMAGGNYAADSNGMSPLKFPVPIHDRFETVEQYDALSR